MLNTNSNKNASYDRELKKILLPTRTTIVFHKNFFF